MSDTVTIYIDDKAYQVPKGANLVDMAKFHADIGIPVFCYHPKMDPVGMCRMCLVELGTAEKDKETGAILTDEQGQMKVRWLPRLQTGCTTTVTDGMVVRTATPKVIEGRDDIIEFLLTSHPLDCPICDKGGECPLQNLTIAYGPGQSRFHLSDKMHLAKHYPLGELIYLDRERCIQCARCTRFSDEIAGDDVLAFHERGRALQIVTVSEPLGFDSYFSGNTTDICPVGALTTADFRFGARPWELKEIPSLDPYGPEGANISLSTRLDRDAGGIVKIKRVMPRQNESVNEIWISDKTRFGHHHSLSPERLTVPQVKVGERMVDAEWDHALEIVASKLKQAGTRGVIAGPTLSNEDLWELRKLVEAAGGGKLGIFPATMTGGDVIAKVGLAKGSNFSAMGKGTVIVVVACDLEESAPIWWLRTKTANDRGATIITVNPRLTKLNDPQNPRATKLTGAKFHFPYEYGDAVGALVRLTRGEGDYVGASKAISEAENLVVIAGAEGLTLDQHGELMKAAANLLINTRHIGRPNNGLLAVWEGANVQGALDLGYSAEATAEMLQNPPEALIIAGCDPLGESAEAGNLAKAPFIAVTSLFPTATTDVAQVILPAQSFAEREGTFTSGERRVQRFYAAQGVIGMSLPEWQMFSRARKALSGSPMPRSAAFVMEEITKSVPTYADMSYPNLAKVERQFPDVGGTDLYYGGTAYQNTGGLGVQWATASESGDVSAYSVDSKKSAHKGLLVVPITRLYDKGMLFRHSTMMRLRIGEAFAVIHPDDATKAKVEDGTTIAIKANGVRYEVIAKVNDATPKGAILLPKRLTDQPSLTVPTVGTIEPIAEPVKG